MVNVALIGNGYFGSKLKKYIKANKNFNLKYICDVNSDLNKVWNDKEITAVIVAVPNEVHYNVVKGALEHDKSVLCEKPLTMDVKQCRELKRLSGNNILLTDFTYTFSNGLAKIIERVKNGEIGKITQIELTRRQMRRNNGDACWLLGSHLFAVLDMFIPLDKLSFKKVDDVIFFDGDITGQIIVSLDYKGKESKIIIYGEKGTITHDFTKGKDDLKSVIEYFYQTLMGKEKSNIKRAILVTKIIQNL